MHLIKYILIILGAGLIGIGIRAALKARGFRNMVLDEVRYLAGTVEDLPAERFTDQDLERVPEPMRRYFKFALPPGQRHIRLASLTLVGLVRTAEGKPFSPFRAGYFIGCGRPGFVWHARLGNSPFFWTEVRDAFLGGRAEMLVSFCSNLTLAENRGPDIDRESLYRYLMEAVFYPTALLPGPNLAWRESGPDSAEAVLTLNGLEARAVFFVGESGAVEAVRTVGRKGRSAGEEVEEEKTARFSEYFDVEGIKIPVFMESGLDRPEDNNPSARYKVTGARFDFPDGGPEEEPSLISEQESPVSPPPREES